jgi:hypothetical protein
MPVNKHLRLFAPFQGFRVEGGRWTTVGRLFIHASRISVTRIIHRDQRYAPVPSELDILGASLESVENLQHVVALRVEFISMTAVARLRPPSSTPKAQRSYRAASEAPSSHKSPSLCKIRCKRQPPLQTLIPYPYRPPVPSMQCSRTDTITGTGHSRDSHVCRPALD